MSFQPVSNALEIHNSYFDMNTGSSVKQEFVDETSPNTLNSYQRPTDPGIMYSPYFINSTPNMSPYFHNYYPNGHQEYYNYQQPQEPHMTHTLQHFDIKTEQPVQQSYTAPVLETKYENTGPYINHTNSANDYYGCGTSNQSHDNQSFKPLKASKTLGKSRRSSKEKSPKGSSRKKIDRFDGTPEEEVAKKLLPDHIDHNLDILIIGINPGLHAAHKGHHYAGPGNHFWKCLYLSGLIPEQFTAYDDIRMFDYGIGFTNIVARTTRGSADLTRKEIAEGGELLITKLKYYQPKIAVFNGKGIYEIFSKKKDFAFGKQPEKIEGTNTIVWVMPSSSARCSQLPRATDKVPFYVALKKLRDHINGVLPHLNEEEIVFSDIKLKRHIKQNDLEIEGQSG